MFIENENNYNHVLRNLQDYMLNEINIQKIIDKFLEHNTLFSTKDFLWFNNDLNFKNKKPISQKMLTDAIQYKCYLALVDIKVLIDKCIC